MHFYGYGESTSKSVSISNAKLALEANMATQLMVQFAEKAANAMRELGVADNAQISAVSEYIRGHQTKVKLSGITMEREETVNDNGVYKTWVGGYLPASVINSYAPDIKKELEERAATEGEKQLMEDIKSLDLGF